MAVKPAAGPETLVCDPLKIPTTSPPTIPEIKPAMGSASDAMAMPRQSGSATRKTIVPDKKSLAIVFALNFVSLIVNVSSFYM